MKLLRLAGEATQVLANPSHGAENKQNLSLQERKDAFKDAARDYYSLLSEVDVTLRRQILALEEANIIPAQASRDIVAPAGKGLKKEQPPTAPEAGARGNLDVGWLNSRNDRVGKEMEAELWTDARELIERLNTERAQHLDEMDSS